jgi:hypothetical protein
MPRPKLKPKERHEEIPLDDIDEEAMDRAMRPFAIEMGLDPDTGEVVDEARLAAYYKKNPPPRSK